MFLLKLLCIHVAEIKNVTVNNREAIYEYNDVYRTKLYDGSTVHQHHQLRKRLREITKLDWGELAITLPKQVKIEPQVHSLKESRLMDRSLLGFLRSLLLRALISPLPLFQLILLPLLLECFSS